MPESSPVATEVTSMFDDLEEVANRILKRADAELETAESTSDDATSPQDRVGRAAHHARAVVLTEGARGLQKLAADPGTELSPDEELGLEAIVLLEGRPALLVQGGDFPPLADLPPEWSLLDQQRDAIRSAISRVGRIEVGGHPDLDWVGTGFLVAPDLVMTNRHVANEFARRDGEAWSFRGGRSAAWDVLEELGSPAQLAFTVSDIVGIHDADDVDLALLRVTADETSTPLPEPLEVMARAPQETVGRPVYVVGYPAWDGRRNEPEPMSRIFMDVYNVKRLHPGATIPSPTPDSVLRHDCSTLGGNSGSPVFDLATHQVIGLHFGGRYRTGNVSVPLWRMVDDPLVRSAGINFAA